MQPGGQPVRQISNLQILRAAAALMVAFGHAQHDALVQSLNLGAGFERVHTLPWGAGVDLFFVISGFILVYASERVFGRSGGRADFLSRRIARIVPLYWLFLSLYIGLVVQAALGNTRAMPAFVDIVASFGFWPTDAFGDGIPRPLLTLGWTLNYEMFFYVTLAVFVGLPRVGAVLGTSLVLLTLVGLGELLSPTSAALYFWTRPIILEFCFGMGLALLLRGGVSLGPTCRCALVLLALAILFVDPLRSSQQALDWTTPNDFSRLLSWGVPAALIVAATILGPQNRPSPVTRAGVALGDASFALYLVHPFVIVGIRKLWLLSELHLRLGLWSMVVTSLILSCVAAILIHHSVERPLTEWAQRVFQPRRSQRVAASA